MRIDKYIWAVRLFKTRSLASKACQSGQVKINEAESKASKEIKVGDLISVRFNPIWKTYKVLAIPKSRIGPKLIIDNVLETTSPGDLELLSSILEQNRQNKFAGQKGRPTKKDRRDIEKYL